MSEKSERPTSRRLWEARRKGQVAKSDRLASAAVVLALALSIPIAGPGIGEILLGAFRHHLELATQEATALSVESGLDLLEGVLRTVSRALAPLFAIAIFAAAGAVFLQVGPLFSTHPIAPAVARLSPTANLRTRLFGKEALLAFARSFLEVAVALLALGWVVKASLREIGLTVREPAAYTSAVTAHLLIRLMIVAGGALLCLGVVDLFLRWRQHLHALRMSKEEIAQEQRQTEGDPRHRAARRRLHREILETYSPAAPPPGLDPLDEPPAGGVADARADTAARSRSNSSAGGKPGAQ